MNTTSSDVTPATLAPGVAVNSAMIDAATAQALGWPKLKYAAIERERRWLCQDIPMNLVRRAESINDLYLAGTRLRLREALSLSGGETIRRLTRKADIDARTRLITSIYLAPEEFALFSKHPGRRVEKIRHHLAPAGGVEMSIDSFQGPLAGLILAEAEFEDAASIAIFPSPTFAVREVTEDPRYRGATLALDGLPEVG